MRKFEKIMYNPSIEDVLSVLPFFFNPDNSNVSVRALVDGCVVVSVTFGTGEGWESLASDLASEFELSVLLGEPGIF